MQSVRLNLAGLGEVLSNVVANVRHTIRPDRAVPFSDQVVGKTFLITGGNSGVGKATAQLLASACAANVIITSRSMDRAVESAQDIRSMVERTTGTDCKA